MTGNDRMNALIRQAAGRGPAANELQAPGDNASEAQITAWVQAKQAQRAGQTAQGRSSADGGAKSEIRLSASQMMNQLIQRAYRGRG